MKFLKKFSLLVFASAALAACAGEPPEWWNPGGAYSTLTPPKNTAMQPAPDPSPARTVAPAPQPAVIRPAQDAPDDNFTPVKEDPVEVTDLPSPSVLDN